MALASAALAVRSAASARGAAGRYNDVDGQAARRAAVGWAVMSAKKVGGVAGLGLAGLLGFVDDCARVGRMGVATEVGVGARAVPAIVDDVARVAPMADDVARVAPVRAAPGVAGEARLAPVTIADDVGVAPAAADDAALVSGEAESFGDDALELGVDAVDAMTTDIDDDER